MFHISLFDMFPLHIPAISYNDVINMNDFYRRFEFMVSMGIKTGRPLRSSPVQPQCRDGRHEGEVMKSFKVAFRKLVNQDLNLSAFLFSRSHIEVRLL